MMKEIENGVEEEEEEPLPLWALNHVSLLCTSVVDSMEFYQKVLGFVPIKRPGTFNFGGAWLFNYGVGIHLVESKKPDFPPKKELNPIDNHISFQCEDMSIVERKLQKMSIKYIKRTLEEGGAIIEQTFFHDPDGFMIEICNCERLTLVPLCHCSKIRLPSDLHNPPIALESAECDT
ncbi:hypothetical protein SUGI_0882260 [Cryptomeria japonica]|uniref:glyoxylase I 4 n=1 Tax=Cryptomeria japonica TaxID=3369 RepID=UPI0024148B19|nr:glyoxylase I 4 [Cryptomeria japonica]GLJ42557.1 hypothetical protein SUGI_0882260 [Cryptomeria japonica]